MTSKQQRFVEEYVRDLNATQAARRAGYSEKTAYSQGHRLLANIEIQSAIAERTDALAERAEMDAEWVLRELKATYYAARSANQHGAAVRALELAGRRWKLFSETLDFQRAREEAERLAHEYGLDAAEIIAEAERMTREHGRARHR